MKMIMMMVVVLMKLSCKILENKINVKTLVLGICFVFITRSELRKALFLAPSVCGFLFVYEISRDRWTDLHQIYMEDVFGPCSDE